MVQKKFKEFCNSNIHLDRAAEKLPSRLQDIDEYSYPAFLTSHQLLLMLDASVGAPYFFDRKKDHSLKANLQGWMDNDCSDSIHSLLRKDLDSEMDISNGSNGFRADENGEQKMAGTQQVDVQEWLDDDGSHDILPLIDQDSNQVENGILNNGRNSFIEPEDVEQQMAGIKQIKVNPSHEVTYEVFVTEVWPHLKKKMKGSYDPSLVWTEIMSVIKGSFEALSNPCGYLSKDEYIEVGRKRAPCFSGERENIYKVFTDYNGFIKKHKNLFDETDLIHSIFRRLRNIRTIPWVIHQIFVDETQDFTQAELYLLIQICQDPNQMFLTGDTAQSIMRGISFRFEDLKALFFHAQQSMQAMNKREIVKPPELYQLTQNYRSHMGILSLASSVLDLLDIFFPESFDRLVRDQGLFNGPQPILLESSNFSDLAVLLRGNQRKSSQIEFGAHQAILVVDEAARAAVPKELQFGLILTIYEAKGLEFDDVLLYNFFKDSQASKEWRLVSLYMEQMFQDSKESTQGPSTSKKGLAKIYQDMMQQERSRPLTFDNLHKILNSELKHLYTAVTRARVNLWIFDEDVEKRAPMFEYFKAKNLVRCLTLDETDKSKLINTVFTESSSADDWKCRGDYFMKLNLYEAAAKCFEISGETSSQKVALAHHIALAAGKMSEKPHDMKEEFLKAARLFLECNIPTKAAICLQNARKQELAAKLYENIRQEFESRGNPVPQILIDGDPFKNFSEEYLNIMLADFHHRHNDLNKMMLTLERLPCWNDRVQFLKDRGHMVEAIQILEENGG
ncbi:hypothetical protein ACJMK2_001006 [Sinanodonta woodiana]|uniref:UvrD-like helicase ATP-binding domain-containing protein n=1 Tax=Sinanodonta woodiana TaxID=1069815 RepID=A0ABD3XSM5_SINWO